jgi:hypothetical protein
MNKQSKSSQKEEECENVPWINTLFRAMLSVLCFSIGLEGVLPTWANIALGAIGLFLFTTAVTGTCILNKLFGSDH